MGDQSMPVIFFLLWIVFNGKVTTEIVLTGLPVTALVSLFSYRLTGYSAASDLKLIRNIPLLILYVLNLIREIAISASAVMLMIIRGRAPEPVIIEFRSGLASEAKNVLLANSITLTPGTITMFQEGDRFVIHCLRPEYGRGIDDSSFIRLLRRFK